MKICFVLPSEDAIFESDHAHIIEIIHVFVREGNDVEVLEARKEPCGPDHWSRKSEIPVRVFQLNKRYLQAEAYIKKKIKKNQVIYGEEEAALIAEASCSDDLLDYLDRNGSKYDRVVFIGLRSGTTYFGAMAFGEKASVIPLLEEQKDKVITLYRNVLTRVGSVLCLTKHEADFLEEFYGVRSSGKLLYQFPESIAETDWKSTAMKHTIPSNYVLALIPEDAEEEERAEVFVSALESGSPETKIFCLPKHSTVIERYMMVEKAKALLVMQDEGSVCTSVLYALYQGCPVLADRRCTASLRILTDSGAGHVFPGLQELKQFYKYILINSEKNGDRERKGQEYAARWYGDSEKQHMMRN